MDARRTNVERQLLRLGLALLVLQQLHFQDALGTDVMQIEQFDATAQAPPFEHRRLLYFAHRNRFFRFDPHKPAHQITEPLSLQSLRDANAYDDR